MNRWSRLTTQIRQGSERAGERLQADLHIVGAFGLCIHHEEAVIEVLFGPPPVGQEEVPQRWRQFHREAPEAGRTHSAPSPPYPSHRVLRGDGGLLRAQSIST